MESRRLFARIVGRRIQHCGDQTAKDVLSVRIFFLLSEKIVLVFCSELTAGFSGNACGLFLVGVMVFCREICCEAFDGLCYLNRNFMA